MEKVKLNKSTIKTLRINGYRGDAYLVTQREFITGIKKGLIEDPYGCLLNFERKLTKRKKENRM